MSRDRSISALTDEQNRLVQAAEQDLDRLLSVEPSADFAARIRMRVRERERPVWWHGRWMFAAAAAASIVVIAGTALAVGTIGRTREHHAAGTSPAGLRRDVALPGETRRLDRAGGGAHSPTSVLATAARGDSRRNRLPSTRAAVPADRAASPVIVIDPGRRDSVDRLLAMVREGIPNLPVATPQNVAEDLTVSPVVVKEIEVPLLLVSDARSTAVIEDRDK
jgi:hypothetical protein